MTTASTTARTEAYTATAKVSPCLTSSPLKTSPEVTGQQMRGVDIQLTKYFGGGACLIQHYYFRFCWLPASCLFHAVQSPFSFLSVDCDLQCRRCWRYAGFNEEQNEQCMRWVSPALIATRKAVPCCSVPEVHHEPTQHSSLLRCEVCTINTIDGQDRPGTL